MSSHYEYSSAHPNFLFHRTTTFTLPRPTNQSARNPSKHPSNHLIHPHPQGHGNQRFVFEGVGGTIRYGPADSPWPAGEPHVNTVVFIGLGLDRNALMRGFR